MGNKLSAITILPLICAATNTKHNEFEPQHSVHSSQGQSSHASQPDSPRLKRSDVHEAPTTEVEDFFTMIQELPSKEFMKEVFNHITTLSKNPMIKVAAFIDLDHTVTTAAFEMTAMAYQLMRFTYKFKTEDIGTVFGFESAEKACHPSKNLQEIVDHIKLHAKSKDGFFSPDGIEWHIARWSKLAYNELKAKNECIYLSTTIAARLRYGMSEAEIKALADATRDFNTEMPGDSKFCYETPLDFQVHGKEVCLRFRANAYPEMISLIKALKASGVTPFIISASQEEYVKYAVKNLGIDVEENHVYGTKTDSIDQMLKGEGRGNDGGGKQTTIQKIMKIVDEKGRRFFGAIAIGDTNGDLPMMKEVWSHGGYALVIMNWDHVWRGMYQWVYPGGTAQDNLKARHKTFVQPVSERLTKWVIKEVVCEEEREKK